MQIVDKRESNVECTSCEKTFPVKAKLLHHRKNTQIDSVQTCRNIISGFCKYGSENCRFKHGDFANNAKNENIEKVNDTEEVIEKIFQMVEKITQQIMEIREINKLK